MLFARQIDQDPDWSRNEGEKLLTNHHDWQLRLSRRRNDLNDTQLIPELNAILEIIIFSCKTTANACKFTPKVIYTFRASTPIVFFVWQAKSDD